MKIKWMPKVEKAHTYASENAEVYRAFDRGQEDMQKRCHQAFVENLPLDIRELAMFIHNAHKENEVKNFPDFTPSDWNDLSIEQMKRYDFVAEKIVQRIINGKGKS